MRITTLVIVLGVVVASAAGPAEADDGPRIVGKVTAEGTGEPVSGATIYVTGRAGTEQIVTSGADGTYRATVKHGGAYAVVIAFDRQRSSTRIEATPGSVTTVNGVVDLDPGEVIVLTDLRRPPIAAAMKALRRTPPPYSDAAIEHDAWTLAWFLLDIDARGVVTRLKFLKRPGYDLEATAIKEAFGTRFNAARGPTGEPIRSMLIWPLEWQSYWWLVAINAGITTSYGRSGGVPCNDGHRPLNLDSKHPVYKDCTPPDLEKMKTETWINAPN